MGYLLERNKRNSGNAWVSGPLKSGTLANPGFGVLTQQVHFTETGAGTYTGTFVLPAGATLLDIIVDAIALWDAATSASLEVGDATDPDGYFTAVDLKATDLLAGESLSFGLAGGVQGAYIANSHVTPRYSATAKTITATVASVGAGTTGRTLVSVVYAMGKGVDANGAAIAAEATKV